MNGMEARPAIEPMLMMRPRPVRISGKSLRDGDGAEHVHLKLPSPVRQGQEQFDGTGHADAGVVHQAGEPDRPPLPATVAGGGNRSTQIGDVEADGHEARAGLLLQTLAVGRVTDTREDAVPERVQREGAGGPDA